MNKTFVENERFSWQNVLPQINSISNQNINIWLFEDKYTSVNTQLFHKYLIKWMHTFYICYHTWISIRSLLLSEFYILGIQVFLKDRLFVVVVFMYIHCIFYKVEYNIVINLSLLIISLIIKRKLCKFLDVVNFNQFFDQLGCYEFIL